MAVPVRPILTIGDLDRMPRAEFVAADIETTRREIGDVKRARAAARPGS